MSQPVPLCRRKLANGKPCRQPAIKGEQGCRHHTRPFRHAVHDITHEESMAKLENSLNAMAMPELLLALQQKLNRIHAVIPAYPEAQLALEVALERLAEIRQVAPSPASPEPLPRLHSLGLELL